jgi:O-antigen ligase
VDKVQIRSVAEKSVLTTTFFTVLVVAPYWVMDPINLPKMALVGCLSFFSLGLILPLLNRNLFQVRKAVFFLVILWTFDLLLIQLFSGRSFSSNLYGISGRNTGVLTYLAFGFILLSSSIVSDSVFLKKFQKMFTVLGLTVATYGFIQHLGYEPFPYISAYENSVIGTFGNPNFQSAFLGIIGSFLFVTIFEKKLGTSWRAFAVMLLVFVVFEIKLTNSWQGFFNLAAGTGVALVSILYKLNKKRIAAFMLSLGALIFVMVALAMLNLGPLSTVIAKSTLEARRVYWEAAGNILFQNPIFGAGLDGFGDWFRRGRSVTASEVNGNLIADSAHSVPLDIASGGGFPLLFLYVALIGLTIFSIVKVTRDSDKNTFLFISLTAAWTSYQAQSLISINQIGVGIIGWVLMGLIIGYAYPPIRPSATQIARPKQGVKTSGKGSIRYFIPSLVALLIGSLISLPPYISANRFYEGLKSSDARVITSTAYLAPLDLRRMMVAANILERNKFYKESIEITKAANKAFPDSFDTWGFLARLTLASDADKSQAEREQMRLDPNFKP